MGEQLWGQRRPGEMAHAVELPEGHAVVVGEPDWIKIPPGMEGAGTQLRVLAIGRADCPRHPGRDVKTYRLERNYYVAECTCDAKPVFQWYKWGKADDAT